jgi:hypothetical protein
VGLRSVCVDGEPPTFNYPMGQREKEWRQQVLKHLTGWRLDPTEGIRAEFVVTSDRRRGHSFDLDNMAKPVFDAFQGGTPRYVEVERYVGRHAGVVLTLGLPEPALPPFQCWVQNLWRGSKRDADPYPGLTTIPQPRPDKDLFVHLCFHEPVSLTDFGLTGVVKPTIDHLWPAFGGNPGSPHDHLIRRLVLVRSDERPSGVSVCVGELASPGRVALFANEAILPREAPEG